MSQIARQLGHDRKTIRVYLRGDRAPGQRRARTESLAPFTAYIRQRSADDRHLRSSGAFGEIALLGYASGYSTFRRDLRRNGIKMASCSCRRDQHRASLAAVPRLLPGPLPVRVAPISGETMSSYLARVAGAVHLPLRVITGVLPACFASREGACDDLGGPEVPPFAASELAALTGITQTALTNALPALASWREGMRPPVRSCFACRRCAARHGQRDPVPVHLPAWQRACTRHRIWLGHDLQVDLTAVPDITAASRQAARLAGQYGTTMLVLAETIARGQTAGSPAARRRAAALAATTPGLDPAHPDTAEAAAYPDTIRNAVQLLRSPDALLAGPT